MGALAVNETGPRPRAGVLAWVLCLARPGRVWRATRIDNCDDAEAAIALLELRERAEAARFRVELVRADGRTVVATNRVFDRGLWRDADEVRPS